MKRFILFNLFLFGCWLATAQNYPQLTNARFKLNVSTGVQLPMKSFSDGAKTGFGGEFNAKYLVNGNIGIGLGVGYYTFGLKDIYEHGHPLHNSLKGNYSIIPIVGKFSYAFGPFTLKPYLGADLGLYIYGLNHEYPAEWGGLKSLGSDNIFGFAPVFGFEYSISENFGLDINTKCNFFNNLCTVAVSAGIVISF